MSTDPHDLSIEELERLLAEKRQQQRARNRFNTRLTPQRNLVEQGAQKVAEVGTQHKPSVNIRRVGNRVLLAVEVCALLGLLLVVVAVFLQLQTLNQET